METKIAPDTRRVLALLYATRRAWTPERVRREAQTLAALLREHANAAAVDVHVPCASDA